MFKKIIEKINSLRKRIGIFLVVAYSNRMLDRQIRLADELHGKYKTRYYVIFSPFTNQKKGLMVINRKGFRSLKRIFKVYSPKESTLKAKEGSYYYTADAGENDRMSTKEAYLRRQAFIDYKIYLSGLNRKVVIS